MSENSEDAKSANLDEELDALDIDNDFTLSFNDGAEEEEDDDYNDSKYGDDSKDFDAKSNKSDEKSKEEEEEEDVVIRSIVEKEVPKKKDVINPDYSKQQLARDEVFSRHYKPTKEEETFIKDVGIKLCVSKQALVVAVSSSSSTATTALKLLSSNGKDANDDPDYYRGRNIVLKRGVVTMSDGEEKELLLLTHGFIVAKQPLDTNKKLRYSLIEMVVPPPKIDACHIYQNVAWVKDLWQLSSKESYSIRIHDQGKKKELQFNVSTLDEKMDWLHAWERVLLQNRSHAKLSPDERDARIVGWQHALLQTSLYTAAVTGQSFFGAHHLQKSNVLDEYNGLAPLHYAAMHNQVHVIDELLSVEEQHQTNDWDADVELEDADGRTPMYYAERDNMVPAMEALQRGGAQASAALYREQHGALVEQAREIEELSKHEQEHAELMMAGKQQQHDRRGSWLTDAIAGLDDERVEDKVKNHQAQAHSAQSHMKDALSGIQDRGNKINDLGDKTADLEDNAAEYQSLAAQMRQKLEKQNKGLNFLNPFAK